MASELSSWDRMNSTKLEPWLKTQSNERLRRELKPLKKKLHRAAFTMCGNAITALFTVPTTLGVSAVAHTAAHVAAQVKYNGYVTQVRCYEAELKRRGVTC